MGIESGSGELHAAVLRRVAVRLRSEPAALIAPDDVDWQGPARRMYEVMHRFLVLHVEEAIESVEQAQWQIDRAMDAAHGGG